MKKSVLSFIISSALLAAIPSAFSVAQESRNISRVEIATSSNMYIPPNSSIHRAAETLDNGAENENRNEVLITASLTQVPEGILKNKDGQVLNESQIQRLQAIFDNNMHQFLGLRIDAAAPLLPSYKSSYYYRQQFFDLPAPLSIPQEVTITAQPSTWSGDADRTRFYFQTYLADETPMDPLVDTGERNWTSAGWQWNSPLEHFDRTMEAGSARFRFFGHCKRVKGSYCSAVINQAYLVFNADLPKLGEAITVVSQ